MYNICNLTSHVQRSIAVTSGVILKELEALFNFDYQVDPHFDKLNDVLCGYYYRNCSTLPNEFFTTISVHFSSRLRILDPQIPEIPVMLKLKPLQYPFTSQQRSLIADQLRLSCPIRVETFTMRISISIQKPRSNPTQLTKLKSISNSFFTQNTITDF